MPRVLSYDHRASIRPHSDLLIAIQCNDHTHVEGCSKSDRDEGNSSHWRCDTRPERERGGHEERGMEKRVRGERGVGGGGWGVVQR